MSAVEYAHLLVALHRLLAEGQGESEEHEALCERLDEQWAQLEPDEQDLLSGLSGDLYMLQGQEVLEKDDEQPPVLVERLTEAWNAKDYRRVLHLLRRVQEPWIPADRVAYVRGRCWAALGLDDAALAFFDHACRLRPTNGSYVYLALDEVLRMERVEEAVERANAIGNDPAAPPRALFAAGHALLWAAQRGARFDGKQIHARIIEILGRALALESAAEPGQRLRSVLVQGYVEVGVCYEQLGKVEQALRAYSEALEVDPDSDAALAARGMLRMNRGERERAIEDFQRAVELRTPLVWPYLHLAFQELKAGQYERCISLCELGLAYTGEDRLRAALYEWMVLSELMLRRSPARVVEELLERALDLAPLNARIARYRDRYAQQTPIDIKEVPWELADEAANDNAKRDILRRVAALAAA